MSDHVPSNTFHGGKGTPLSGVLAGSTAWERTVVPIGGELRLVAWVLMALSVALAVGNIVLRHSLVADRKPGFFLVGWPWVENLIGFSHRLVPIQVAGAVVLTALCVLTAGFREAGRRVQLILGAVLVLALVGVLAPAAALAVAAVNLALWLAIGVFGLIAIAVFIASFFDS